MLLTSLLYKNYYNYSALQKFPYPIADFSIHHDLKVYTAYSVETRVPRYLGNIPLIFLWPPRIWTYQPERFGLVLQSLASFVCKYDFDFSLYSVGI